MTRFKFYTLFLVVLGFSGCAKEPVASTSTSLAPTLCAKTLSATGAGSSGTANIFDPDPIMKSGNAFLSPTSNLLDSYRTVASLSNLSGTGILSGTYVDIGNGTTCGGNNNAFSSSNHFTYSHKDVEFQETMAYYWGDKVRSNLSIAGYLQPVAPLKVVAHCMNEDNAYYSRQIGFGVTTQSVCLGDSVYTPGASYADDGQVTVHEVQHGATVNNYSLSEDLNKFWYDEAGSINEGISDFMALMTTASSPNTGSLDQRLFSRWALGTFLNSNQARGANQCPQYDSGFSGDCVHFSADPSLGFSALNKHVSFAYPDGLGWPYAKTLSTSSLKNVFNGFGYQEEIHNNGTIVEGALWDVYQALKGNYPDPAVSSLPTAATLTTKILMEAVKNLPKGSNSNHSPVTMPRLGAALVTAAATLVPASAHSDADKTAISNALAARGLVSATQLGSSWAVAADSLATPGMRVVDRPSTLVAWLNAIGANSSVVTQTGTTSTNGLPDPGEVVAVWFDLQNNSATTAGGVLITASSPDTDISFSDSSVLNVNYGIMNPSYCVSGGQPVPKSCTQIMYGKVNGTAIVSALTDSGSSTYNLPTSNSYFGTNLYYASNFTTAIFVKIASSAAHGKTVHLSVTVTPANGTSQVLDYPLTIN